MLLAHNADINHQDTNGMTMLHLAVDENKVSCIDLLMENKAKLDIKDSSGRSAVDIARTKARWKQGTPVRVRSGITPKYGWGSVEPGDVGKVMSQLGTTVFVDFKKQSSAWRGIESELEQVSHALLVDSEGSSGGTGSGGDLSSLLLLGLLLNQSRTSTPSYGVCDKCKRPFSSPSEKHQCCKCNDYYCLSCIEVANRERTQGIFVVRDTVKICPTCLLIHKILQ